MKPCTLTRGGRRDRRADHQVRDRQSRERGTRRRAAQLGLGGGQHEPADEDEPHATEVPAEDGQGEPAGDQQLTEATAERASGPRRREQVVPPRP